MGNTSSTGGVLSPLPPITAVDDAALDAVFQSLVASVTGIAGNYVRPRWQPTPPKQPEPNVNWCAIGITEVDPDDGPWLVYDPLNDWETNTDHEVLTVLASFYGPAAQQNCRLLRAGLNVPQNTEALLPYSIRYLFCSPIRTAPELINQQWRRKYDLTLSFRRAVTLVYGIESIASATINLIDDTYGVDDTIVVENPEPL